MPSTTQLRNGVATLSAEAARELDLALRDAETPKQLEAALRDAVPALVAEYGAGAATLSADWYDELREERGIAGAFTAIPADPPLETLSLVNWAMGEAAELATVSTLVAGGMQRRIANYSRLTVAGSSIADPRAHGWRRVGAGQCEFCRMLIGRGAVYSESTVNFDAHDHCNCAAEPAWR